MNILIKRIIVLVFVTGLFVVVSGCHTAHGFGHDVKDAGQSIENHTDK